MKAKLGALIESGPVLDRQRGLLERTKAALGPAAQRGLDLSDALVVVPAERPTRARDLVHDGSLIGRDGIFSPLTPIEQIAPVLPDDGKPATQQVILINGIMTDIALQQKDMQGLANTGAKVIGIHNSTHGIIRDLWECLMNKLDIGDTPSIDTLVRLIAVALRKGESIRVIGHSQGALVVACALKIVSDALEREGLSKAETKEVLGAISVETYGGASRTYVDGPRYLHVLNRADLVPMLTGIGLDAINPFGHVGEGATIRDFVRFNRPDHLPPIEEGLSEVAARAVDQSVHGPRDVYWQYRSGKSS